jgi:hypothetical protein
MPPQLAQPVCGECEPGSGVGLVTCTETNINNTEICGTCHPESSNSVWVTCTETNINDTCDTCYNADYQSVTCTTANLAQQCETCTMPDATTGLPCTNANIISHTGTSCAVNGHGTGSTPWGGYNDCCNDVASLGTSGETCTSLGYGAPGTWGGVSGCCSDYGQDNPACTSGSGPWGGEPDCCYGYHSGSTTDCYDLGYGGSGSSVGWTGDPECCVNYRGYLTPRDHAVCLEE